MKNKRLLSVLPVIAIMVLFNGCHLLHHLVHTHGNGRVVTRERTTGDFTGVVLEGTGDVKIHYSADCRVTVTTDSNIQDIITTKIIGDFLYIDSNCIGGFNSTKLIIDVYMPEVKNIRLRGAGNISVSGGKTPSIKISLSGVGNINAQNLETEDADVTLSGTGDIRIWVTDNLTGKLSGVGNIMYRGNPWININKTGVGSIKKI